MGCPAWTSTCTRRLVQAKRRAGCTTATSPSQPCGSTRLPRGSLSRRTSWLARSMELLGRRLSRSQNHRSSSASLPEASSCSLGPSSTPCGATASGTSHIEQAPSEGISFVPTRLTSFVLDHGRGRLGPAFYYLHLEGGRCPTLGEGVPSPDICGNRDGIASGARASCQ